MSGEVAKQEGNDHPTNIPTSAYQTADGHMNVAASGTAMWKKLAAILGRDDLVANPLYLDAKLRSKNRKALNAEIEAVMKTKPSKHWEEQLNKAGIPCGPIYTIDKTFADPQVKHLGIAQEIISEKLGKLTLVSSAINMHDTPKKIRRATQDAGKDSDEILATVGYSKEQIAELRTKGVI